MVKVREYCRDLLNEPLCTAGAKGMLIAMSKIEFTTYLGALEKHLPLMITILLFASGDYASLIRHLRFFF